MPIVFLAAILALQASGGPGQRAYGITEARERLVQVGEALESFTALTELLLDGAPLTATGAMSPVTFDPAALRAIGYTYWEEQHIGFPNFVHCIGGTLEAQALEILELRIRVMELEGAGDAEIGPLLEEAEAQRALVEELSGSGWVD